MVDPQWDAYSQETSDGWIGVVKVSLDALMQDPDEADILFNVVSKSLSGDQYDDDETYAEANLDQNRVRYIGDLTRGMESVDGEGGFREQAFDPDAYAVATVPLPAAAWAGLALMGAMGGVAGVRRKLKIGKRSEG